MKTGELKLPYDGAELEILKFVSCDIVTASGGTEAGGWGDDKQGWT